MGWVKLHRKFLEWEWYKDSNMVHLFIHLLISANHEENSWKGIKIERGQLVTGRKSLSEDTGITERSIRTCMERLKSTNELSVKTTNKFSIITICNYEKYQSYITEADQQNDQQPDQQTTNKRPTNDHKQEYKNDKNKINKEVYISFLNLFNEITGRNFKGTIKDQKQFDSRIKEGFLLEDFGRAIKNCKSDPFHNENPNYLTPEFITRADKFQRYLNYQNKIKESSFD